MKNHKADDHESNGVNRRSFIAKTIFAGAGLTALAASQNQAGAQTRNQNNTKSASNASMGRRRLGKLEVSAIGLGVQNMHRKYETTVPYRPEMISILRAAYDRGITFFDCAEAYGPFENERILGEAIEPFRNKVRITSKFGWNIDQQTGQRLPGLNSKPDHIKLVVDGSLKRLRTDRIDLLYQHRVDPEVPIEDVAGAIKDLMDHGKVLHWGLSEPGIQTIRRAHAALPLTAIQNEYSMATQENVALDVGAQSRFPGRSFHEKAVFVHMGATMTKTQELDVIRSGGIQYKTVEIQEASVRFIDKTAVLLNKIRLVAVVGGNEVTNPFMVTEVYVQQSGTWKLASLSFTRLLTQ